MSDHLRRDAQEYDPDKVRPRDLDDALLTHAQETAKGLDALSQGIEGIKKRTAGIWGVAVAFGVGVWYLSQFVSTYNSVMANGSPAMLLMKGELQTAIASVKKSDDDRYGQLTDILVEMKATNVELRAANDLTNKRLDRLEDKGK